MGKTTRFAVWVVAGCTLAVGTAWADCDLFEENESRTTYRRVTWDDFRGPGLRRTGPPRGLTTMARIATSIALEPYQVELTQDGSGQWSARIADVCVRALMYKDLSGYKASGMNDWALAHEQAHFDLTEQFARDLRSRLARLELVERSKADASRSLEQEVKRLYAAAAGRWRDTQKRYDRETRHGVKRQVQRRWFAEIRRLVSNRPVSGSDQAGG